MQMQIIFHYYLKKFFLICRTQPRLSKHRHLTIIHYCIVYLNYTFISLPSTRMFFFYIVFIRVRHAEEMVGNEKNHLKVCD